MNSATVISLPLTTSLKRHWPRTQVDNCQVWGSSCKSPHTNGTKQPSHDNILTATRTEQPSFYGHTANRAVSKWAPFLCLITPSEATAWIKVNMYNLSKSKVCVKSFGVFFHCLSKTAISKQKWTVISRKHFNDLEPVSCKSRNWVLIINLCLISYFGKTGKQNTQPDSDISPIDVPGCLHHHGNDLLWLCFNTILPYGD